MRIIKETPQLRMIRQWYERIGRGAQPTQDELQSHFRGYADQAEVLVRRVKDGQPWEDFVMASTAHRSLYAGGYRDILLSNRAADRGKFFTPT